MLDLLYNTFMINVIVTLFSYIALFGQIAIAGLFLLILTDLISKKKNAVKLKKMLQPYAYTLAFLVALIATLGSLFLSEIAHFQPCILCWYQRIAMYPLVILLYLSIVRGENLRPYVITLSAIGLFVALYHYFIQLVPESILMPCSAIGGVSCIKGYTFFFGYMSFPLMSATAFAGIIIFMLFSGKQKK